MIKKGILMLLLVLINIKCAVKKNIPKQMVFHDNWEFKNTKDSIWKHALVPGNVHSDLLDNKIIEDPFVADNELDLQWISENDWEYKTKFLLDKRTLKKQHIELNFEGLDTYASIFLNDSLILKTENAFRSYIADVKSSLRTENNLRIVFENTPKNELKEKEKLAYELPVGNRVFTRKAQFQYGWDWGPVLNTSGIWKPIYLSVWDDFKINDVYIEQNTLNDSIADLSLHIESINQLRNPISFDVYVNDVLSSKFKDVATGNSVKLSLQIKKPKLWWPHNLGEPYLYNIKIVAKNERKILDSYSIKKGLRTIKLVSEKDSIGESFYFKVNNIPVYMKGANYIPQNSLQNKVTHAHYEKLLGDVVDANMNMLRVWGGGIYENDIFYDLCDEKGILVWQDFMFACAMYPGDTSFFKNVEEEAIQNVKRLRNHTSMALWCGNNENAEAWGNWGWQTNRSEKEKAEIWNNYIKLFDGVLPKIVKQFSDTDYWESSPKYARGNPKYKTDGDAHDWWLWHDAYPFEHLENNVPRFMSEFGFQAFPSYEVIKYATQKDSIDISGEAFQTHQKHPRGFDLIREYMGRDFPVPLNNEDYVYMSQLLQAYGMRKGFEAQRRAKPYNMGTLYWQLNDCWPVVSWSSIDYLGNWKALHYEIKKVFKNLLISSTINQNVLKTYIVNDNLESFKGELHLKIIDFNGDEIWVDSKQVSVPENSSTLFYNLPLPNIDSAKTVLIATFNNEKAYTYFVKPKDLRLENVDITKKIIKSDDGFTIELSSSTLQKDVFLYSDDTGRFKDNYFDLLPNETKEVKFITNAESINLKMKTFNNFIRK
jgi:beta-mannosidase